jgi:hypothetical protein
MPKTASEIALRFLEGLPAEKRPYAGLRFWVAGDEWCASAYAGGGGVGGIGATPEAALDAAVDSYLRLERRNA